MHVVLNLLLFAFIVAVVGAILCWIAASILIKKDDEYIVVEKRVKEKDGKVHKEWSVTDKKIVFVPYFFRAYKTMKCKLKEPVGFEYNLEIEEELFIERHHVFLFVDFCVPMENALSVFTGLNYDANLISRKGDFFIKTMENRTDVGKVTAELAKRLDETFEGLKFDVHAMKSVSIEEKQTAVITPMEEESTECKKKGRKKKS